MPQPDLPSQCTMLDHVIRPLQVLDTKHVSAGNSPVCLLQVQWDGLPSSWTTWGNAERLRQEFPNFSAWGQAESQEVGNVTTDSAVAQLHE